MPHQNPPSTIRKVIRQQRKALSPSQQRLAAQRLSIRIARHPSFRQAKSLTAYIASQGEINLTPLIKLAQKQHKACYLPVIEKPPKYINNAKLTMRFSLFPAGSKLTPRLFNIPEPQKKCFKTLGHIDLILCPLVAFDNKGNRIGMGGGFYDRALSRVKKARRRKVWGVAHSLQEQQFTPAPWDIALDGIFTDNKTITAK